MDSIENLPEGVDRDEIVRLIIMRNNEEVIVQHDDDNVEGDLELFQHLVQCMHLNGMNPTENLNDAFLYDKDKKLIAIVNKIPPMSNEMAMHVAKVELIPEIVH